MCDTLFSYQFFPQVKPVHMGGSILLDSIPIPAALLFLFSPIPSAAPVSGPRG
jgi:hypothetical protein